MNQLGQEVVGIWEVLGNGGSSFYRRCKLCYLPSLPRTTPPPPTSQLGLSLPQSPVPSPQALTASGVGPHDTISTSTGEHAGSPKE